jgi:hypothetical protein
MPRACYVCVLDSIGRADCTCTLQCLFNLFNSTCTEITYLLRGEAAPPCARDEDSRNYLLLPAVDLQLRGTIIGICIHRLSGSFNKVKRLAAVWGVDGDDMPDTSGTE